MKYWENLDGVPAGGPLLGLRFLFLITALTLLCAPACTPSYRASASAAVDQSFDALEASRGSLWENTGAGIGMGNHSAAAQTFTIGRSGILTAVAVQIFRGTNSNQNINFEIRRTVNLIPSENDVDILAREKIPLQKVPYALPAFVSVDLKKVCLNVHQGEVLAIVLGNQDAHSGCGWQTASDDHYNGGKRFAKSRDTKAWISHGKSLSGHDLGFITYVDPSYSCRAE
jgi:hypothetical protein